jgi:hypothetical protein
MKPIPLDFLLTPDGSTARKVKKRLAERAPGLHRMVGTWPELLAQVESAYLLFPDSEDWSQNITHNASRLSDAFWASSLKVAPRETIAEIDAALHCLMESAGPDADWTAMIKNVASETRTHRRLSDLSRLLDCATCLPEPMNTMGKLLASKAPPIKAIRVYSHRESMDFNAWQIAVLEKLATDASSLDTQLQSLLESSLTLPETSNATLSAVRKLYSSDIIPPKKINAIRVIAVRDSLAEAEITAGLVQKSIEKGSQISDIGLLLPEDPLTQMAVEDVFIRCGLPLSGIHRSIGKRDLGREVIRELLICLRKPAPIMAISALLTSPLMPWAMDEGQALAQAVMGGDVLLKSTKIPTAARKVMDILDTGATTTLELKGHLKSFLGLMSTEESLREHTDRAHIAAEQIQTALLNMDVFDWEILLYLIRPESLRTVKTPVYLQEAIPVFHEGALPWCQVRQLFVLGFNDRHYPSGAGTSAVFTEAEWEQIAATGWPVVTNDLIRNRQRTVFAKQLAAATDNLTLLYSCRDANGQPLEPSSSLVFLARSLGVEPDKLVLDLDRSKDLPKIPDLPLASISPPSEPRELTVTDLELGVDLLDAFGRGEGKLAPLSPSAADTLMVSPLAWLLRRLDCEPKEWAADDFDVMKAGTLAHSVFEALFQAGQPLPTEEDISDKIPKILRELTLQVAPFLRSADWRVERFKFESEVISAAIHWRKLLESCKANVVGAEQWLRGHYNDVPLHGQCDLLVQLPQDKLLVIDYKKSSSGKRRDRMRSGFDLQAHLYRLMIQTAGLPLFDSPPNDIGIVYYLLNDTTALADSPVVSDGSVPGWEIPANDISSQAMQHLDKRLAQIRRGTIRLNTVSDEDWWSKNAGLPIYALDNSPLLRLFMHTEEDA